jgi:hypothetical protein
VRACHVPDRVRLPALPEPQAPDYFRLTGLALASEKLRKADG